MPASNFVERDLQFDKCKYRTNFEVLCAEWNPKMNLLALASRRGDVVVKRSGWKTGWKICFRKEAFLKNWSNLLAGTSRDSMVDPSNLESICWSPDGEVLLVVLESGKIYFLDAQNGKPLFLKELFYKSNKIKWFELAESESLAKKCGENFLQTLISSSDFNFNTKAPREHASLVHDIQTLCTSLLLKSLIGTFLCVACEIDEVTYVDVFASAVFKVARLNVTQVLMSHHQTQQTVEIFPSTIEVLDILLFKTGVIQIVCKYNVKSQVDGIESFGWNTSILEFDLALSAEKIQVYTKIAISTCWISFCAVYIQEMFAYMTNDWKVQSEKWLQSRRTSYALVLFTFVIEVLGMRESGSCLEWQGKRSAMLFHNSKKLALTRTGSGKEEREVQEMKTVGFDLAFHQRLLSNVRIGSSEGPTSFDFCRDFFLVLSAGVIKPSMHSFLISETTCKDIKQANAFVDDFFPPALQMFKHHLGCIQSSIATLAAIDSQRDLRSENSLLDTLCKIHTKSEALCQPYNHLSHPAIVRFVNFLSQINQSLIVFERRLIEVVGVCEQNRKELKHLLRWFAAICAKCVENEEPCQEADEKRLNYRKIDLKLITKFVQSLVHDSSSYCSTAPTSLKNSDFSFLEKWLDHLKQQDLHPEEDLFSPHTPTNLVKKLDRVLAYLENNPNTESKHGEDAQFLTMLSLTHPEISVQAYEQTFQESTTLPSAIEKCFQQVRTLLKDGISDLSCISTCQIVEIQTADVQCFSSVSVIEWSEVTSPTNRKDEYGFGALKKNPVKSTEKPCSLLAAHKEEEKVLEAYIVYKKDSQLQARPLIPQLSKNALDVRLESNLLPRVLENGLECKSQTSGSSPIIRELKRGSTYKVHHFQHLHSCYYYGMLSVDTNELADTMFAFKASFFGGEIGVDQNTHNLQDVSLLKVSGSRNTAFLLDSTTTRVTWFNLLETKAKDLKVEAGDGAEVECGGEQAELSYLTNQENQENILSPLIYTKN